MGTRLGFSRRTFDRIVEDSLGIPAKRWLRELRFRVALARLREGCRVKELAAELGFENASELTRDFVSFWGITPSRFVIEAKRRNAGGA
ncbi:MAG: helix-turn-helix domain-containing protein [Akkermansiaceae bacterium]|nr:helix-turn-helix domain-containing protein [Akkermansiaceae bacterium]MCF7731280.1 helix-turn-helix domain-containing protein [Akkermansiaceae bacterium]